MTASNMEHMKFIDAVVDSDTAVLRQKESTYQGSWKAAGGRSAWFMLRRNMDRLLNMMKKPPDVHGFSMEDLDDCLKQAQSEVNGIGDCTMDVSIVQFLRDAYVSENIFAKIRENPLGQDGTVLAVCRDLRRYLILIEAEMVARGVLAPEEREKKFYRLEVPPVFKEAFQTAPSAAEIEIQIKAFREPAPDLGALPAFLPKHLNPANVYRLTPGDIYNSSQAGRIENTGTEDMWINVVTGSNYGYTPAIPVRPQGSPPATPETGSQHSSLVPWAVSTSWRFKNGYSDVPQHKVEEFDTWWHNQAPGVFVLEPAVLRADAAVIPHHIGKLYSIWDLMESKYWVLNIRDCPPDARDWFPRLRREINSKERDEAPEWQREMYRWHESGVKWVLEAEHEAWAE